MKKQPGSQRLHQSFLNYETLNEVKEIDFKQYNRSNHTRKNSKNLNNYSDEEIRILREKQSFKSDGGYIYTPGRHVQDN